MVSFFTYRLLAFSLSPTGLPMIQDFASYSFGKAAHPSIIQYVT
jgi:hypothetical protein